MNEENKYNWGAFKDWCDDNSIKLDEAWKEVWERYWECWKAAIDSQIKQI